MCHYNEIAYSTMCVESMNERLVKSLAALSGNTRKAMKLLAKQYEVISFEQTDPKIEYQSNRIVRKQNSYFIIRYFNRENPNEVFEWQLQEDEF